MYTVEIEQDITQPFIKIPEYDMFKYKHVKVIFMTDMVNETPKGQSIDFSQYQVNCFKDIDPVKFQRDIRDEW